MPYLTIIVTYLLLLVAFGLWRGRSVQSQDDFMVAGRKLSAKVLVGTLLATWIGTGSIMGGAGLAYDEGFKALWFDAGVWVALIVIYLIAGRARRLAQYTVPDILELRYNAAARILGTIVTVIAYTAIVSYQFRAGGTILSMLTGISTDQGMILTAVFVIGYTVTAGMISVAYTDVVNGLVMIVGFLIALPVLYSRAGGLETILAALPTENVAVFGNWTVWEAISYALPTMLLLLGESGMYQRFFSARDENTARRAVIGWVAGTIIIETVIALLAIVGSTVYADIESEKVILVVVQRGLPAFVGAIALSAIVAVIVSTADSFLLVPATNLTRDVYQRFINPEATQQNVVRVARWIVVVLGVLAFVQVRFFERILEAAIYAYTMYGVGVTPALLAAFFFKRATAQGGVTSIAVGMTATIVWEVWHPFGWPTVYPALIASLFCLIVVSLLTSRTSEEKLAVFSQ